MMEMWKFLWLWISLFYKVLMTRSLLKIFGMVKMLILGFSKWAASKLKSIAATIGVTFSGYESEVTQLLSRIEKNSVSCGRPK